MNYKVTIAGMAVLFAANSWAADQAAYYTVEKITEAPADGASFGAFPSALSADNEFIGTYSLKANLSRDIDIGLPLTFNRECQYDDVYCDLDYYGSENAGDLSYENGYQAWRNAQSDVSLNRTNSYSSYFMGNTLLSGSDQAQNPYTETTGTDTTDVKVTDTSDEISGDRFLTGYSSAPYDSSGNREFVRRAFIKSSSGGSVTSLLPEFLGDSNGEFAHLGSKGGFTSAYKLKEVTYSGGTTKTLVVGAASVSYPKGNTDIFRRCYASETEEDRYNNNELDNCPGFDTQAFAWDVSTLVAGGSEAELTGFKLATTWLHGNTTNENRNVVFAGSALDINSSGIAVGVSTTEDERYNYAGRQRAIIMVPDADGNYGEPITLTAATADIGDDDDQKTGIYNTWASAVNDSSIIMGNREYNNAKGSNKPTELFVYDNTSAAIKFPLLDKKVLTTKQRLAGESNYKYGANSRGFDMNNAGLVVGEADDYDQDKPVVDGSPRGQTAFLYDNTSGESWRVNDLICSQTADVVTSPYYRIRSARVINESGVVLAEGFEYPNASDYKNMVNAQQVSFKLTPTAGMSPNDSPNCWNSDLLNAEEETYDRQGGAGFWLWLFALPLLLVRRFCK
ncbi:DUF3466 family protein [Psychromonas ossibalaenae]|uniref:DUF3466 family protein n=1 Tax=Psychromonas ossibalaenae TaxID=444922 RepID=UPI000363944F|nr:DUF3466 family protein [Psychromonas ossibalaenae]